MSPIKTSTDAGEALVLNNSAPRDHASSRSAWTIIGHMCALAVAGVFLLAAHEKIIEPRQFALDIGNFRILNERHWNLMAIFLPWWEVGAAIALIVPKTRRAGAVLLTGMLVMFIVAVSYAALYKGYNIECGCFGKHSAAAGWKTIGLDVALLIGTFVSLMSGRRRPHTR